MGFGCVWVGVGFVNQCKSERVLMNKGLKENSEWPKQDIWLGMKLGGGEVLKEYIMIRCFFFKCFLSLNFGFRYVSAGGGIN